jgi:hypothetical protein
MILLRIFAEYATHLFKDTKHCRFFTEGNFITSFSLFGFELINKFVTSLI